MLREIEINGTDTIDAFVQALDQLRRKRGQVDSARELRYVDLSALDELVETITARVESLSRSCVDFLLDPAALHRYHQQIAELEQQAEAIKKVAEASDIAEQFDELGSGLDLLMEIVNSLDIDDTTARTDILERISEVFALLNRAKAVLAARQRDLGSGEAKAEFGPNLNYFHKVSPTISRCAIAPTRPTTCWPS